RRAARRAPPPAGGERAAASRSARGRASTTRPCPRRCGALPCARRWPRRWRPGRARGGGRRGRGALRSALAAKVAAGEVTLVEQLGLGDPKTKTLVARLKTFGAAEGPTLLVLAARRADAERARS